jgi:hypothetical protein
MPFIRGVSKIQNEMSDIAYMMGAAGIVQHVSGGWSSFSSVVAMAKQIPLITTQRYGFNRLDEFAGKGGSPQELMKCDQVRISTLRHVRTCSNVYFL